MDVTVDELADAMIRTGLYFPSERAKAVICAQDILAIITDGKGPEDTGWSAYQDRR